MMIPFFVILIPVFWIVKQLGWINNYAGLIFPSIVSAYGIFLIASSSPVSRRAAGRRAHRRGLGVPHRLADLVPLRAGAGNPGRLQPGSRVERLPLAAAGGAGQQPLHRAAGPQQPAYLRRQEPVFNLRMAGTVLSVIPTVLVFAWLQRFFARGIALTGLRVQRTAEHGDCAAPLPPNAGGIGWVHSGIVGKP